MKDGRCRSKKKTQAERSKIKTECILRPATFVSYSAFVFKPDRSENPFCLQQS